ncbi:MAG: CoA-binding protein, partial [Calditrichaeota bacterium]
MGWHDRLIEDPEQIREILHSIHKIAVIGIKDESHPFEAAHSVPAYLRSNGYDIIPVNPKFDTVFGKPCYKSVLDIPEPVDAVLVFR